MARNPTKPTTTVPAGAASPSPAVADSSVSNERSVTTSDPTHRAVYEIKFSETESYKIGDLLTLSEEEAAAIGPAVEPYIVPLSELTSEQLADAAEAKKREEEIQRMLADFPAYTSQIEEARISGSPLHLVAAAIAEQEAAK